MKIQMVILIQRKKGSVFSVINMDFILKKDG